MSTVIAYVLVAFLVQFCLLVAQLAFGLPVALLLSLASVSLRTKVAGFVTGVGGIALAVAFGRGVFYFIAGPDSYTIGSFLASTVPLIIPISRDAALAWETKSLLEQMSGTTQELAEREIPNTVGSVVDGYMVGLVLAGLWFFAW